MYTLTREVDYDHISLNLIPFLQFANPSQCDISNLSLNTNHLEDFAHVGQLQSSVSVRAEFHHGDIIQKMGVTHFMERYFYVGCQFIGIS